VAVFVCQDCRKTAIRDAKEVGANVCPFCGAAMRVREAPPKLAEAVQTEPRPAPAAPRAKKPAEGDRTEAPPRRRRRKRRRPSAEGVPESDERQGFFDYATIVYLISTVVAVFIWLVLMGVSLAAQLGGVPLLVYGTAVFLTGMVWLYIGALQEMDLPAVGPGMGGAGMAMVLGGCAVLLIRLLIILAYGVLYTISNPYVAWKPALLTVLGIFILISGLVFLRL
jgi:hypothetical protein